MALPTPKTEHEHIRELIDALGRATDCARAQSINPLHITHLSFGQALRDIVTHAQSLGFYRNQPAWNLIAATMDEATKTPISQSQWPVIADQLQELTNKVRNLANRRTH